MPLWAPGHPALVRFKERRCATLEEVRSWVEEELKHTDEHGPTLTGTDGAASAVKVGARRCSSMLVANAALSLLNLCCHLLDRQLAAQAESFEREGGFTERLYRVRTNRRKNSD